MLRLGHEVNVRFAGHVSWSLVGSLLLAFGCGGRARVGTPDGGEATDAELQAVRIIRGDPGTNPWLNLTIEARGLTGVEGRQVSVRVGLPNVPPERLASVEGRVRDQGFRFVFPQVVEPSLYKRKLLFIDVDGDGVCGATADRVYQDFRGQLDSDLTLSLADSVPMPGPEAQMLPSIDRAADCGLLNEPWPDS